MSTAPRRFIVEPETCAVLPRYVRLQFDRIRERWLLLAPERILIPDDIAVEVMQLCDGERSVSNVVTVLAEKYNAPASEIMRDVQAMLQDLADKGFLTETKETIR